MLQFSNLPHHTKAFPDFFRSVFQALIVCECSKAAPWLSKLNNSWIFSFWLKGGEERTSLLILDTWSYLGKRQGSAVLLVHFIGLDWQDNLFRCWIFLKHEVIPEFLRISSIGRFNLPLAGKRGWREVFQRRDLSGCCPGSQALFYMEFCIRKDESGHFFLLLLLTFKCRLWNCYKKAWFSQGFLNTYGVFSCQLTKILTFKQFFVQIEEVLKCPSAFLLWWISIWLCGSKTWEH